ncbi:oligosaccharide flippase family protein [Proteus mirabilis]|nr:oligosaccharide flippase family protein [Proteus mirabilis]EKX4632923.1 oligosaccharide flippase family protein [Proteus mirabilis]ELB4967006.1 oligosaccharide flippase family protein [Proteus mirabilis]ELI8995186.1 oligosaccharide flippase family protein [Proteus mirabilis]HEH1420805.1 oligosaccharide flippase family protein [Proteus mirabilis]
MSIVVDFGFNIHGTKLASENRFRKNKLSIIYSNITVIKLVLVFLCSIIFSFVLKNNEKFNNNLLISCTLFFIILGEALFSQWLFQGLEKIKIAAIINLFSKLILLLFIFIGTNTYLDFFAFPLGLSISSILNGFLSVFCIRYHLKIKIVRPKLYFLKKYFKDSFSFLLSRAVGTIVIKLNTYILGNYVGLSYVAYYDLAEKLVNLLIIPVNMLNQVVYPHIVKNKNFYLSLKIIKILLPIYFIAYILTFLFSEYFILIFAGSHMRESYNILIILYLSIFFNIISYFLGNCTLIVLNKKKEFNNSTYWGLITYALLFFIINQLNIINVYTLSLLIVSNAAIVSIYRIIKVFKYLKIEN